MADQLRVTDYSIRPRPVARLARRHHSERSFEQPLSAGLYLSVWFRKGLLSAVGTTLSSGMPGSLTSPYNQQWNLTIQRTLATNLMLQVAYAGNKGTHLEAFECCGSTPNMNQLPPQDMSLGNNLLNLVPNPFAGLISVGGTLNNPTVQAGQLFLPHPERLSVEPVYAALVNS